MARKRPSQMTEYDRQRNTAFFARLNRDDAAQQTPQSPATPNKSEPEQSKQLESKPKQN